MDFKKGRRKGVFQMAILKHGFNNLSWEQIDSADTQAELDEKEKYWITFYKSDNRTYGYNLSKGGLGGRLNEETKRKLRDINMGHIVTAEARLKISEANTGKHHTEKTKQKISLISKNISAETRKKMSMANTGDKNPFFGKHHTPETRQKMSEAKKGRQIPLTTRQKMSATQRGEKSSSAKITEAVARLIKIDLQAGMRAFNVAIKHNVTEKIVTNIKYGTAWAWLTV
jgi:group I intron endonuclease